jgi:hypothetical protein
MMDVIRDSEPCDEVPTSRGIVNATLGFRVKSGWAAAVLLAGPPDLPQVCDRKAVELSDPAVPGSRQPYHAGMSKLQTDNAKIERLKKIITQAAEASVRQLIANCTGEMKIRAAGVVVGSDIDPSKIANPHIRAHALEGRLFREVLVDALKSCQVGSSVILERELYRVAAKELKRSEQKIKGILTKLGKPLGGSWRSDDKAACLAAWLVHSRSER